MKVWAHIAQSTGSAWHLRHGVGREGRRVRAAGSGCAHGRDAAGISRDHRRRHAGMAGHCQGAGPARQADAAQAERPFAWARSWPMLRRAGATGDGSVCDAVDLAAARDFAAREATRRVRGNGAHSGAGFQSSSLATATASSISSARAMSAARLFWRLRRCRLMSSGSIPAQGPFLRLCRQCGDHSK